MKIQVLSKALIILLWVCTFVVAMCWIFWENPPFDPEPITVVTGLISTAVTALLNEFGSRLEEEEYSLAYALAYGYVNNFVEPLLSELLRMSAEEGKPPVLLIYMPDKLAELEPRNIERVLAKIRLRNVKEEVVNLQFREGRARDVLTVSSGDNRMYFDFPNTLLSLNSLIDFKVESRKNKFSEGEKERLGKENIQRFRTVVEEMLDRKDLLSYVRFVDRNLNFEIGSSHENVSDGMEAPR